MKIDKNNNLIFTKREKLKIFKKVRIGIHNESYKFICIALKNQSYRLFNNSKLKLTSNLLSSDNYSSINEQFIEFWKYEPEEKPYVWFNTDDYQINKENRLKLLDKIIKEMEKSINGEKSNK